VFILANQHIISVSQPLELKNLLKHAWIKKPNIFKLKLARERIEKKGNKKESLCSSRSLDLSSSPCFSLLLIPISPMVVSNGVLRVLLR